MRRYGSRLKHKPFCTCCHVREDSRAFTIRDRRKARRAGRAEIAAQVQDHERPYRRVRFVGRVV